MLTHVPHPLSRAKKLLDWMRLPVFGSSPGSRDHKPLHKNNLPAVCPPLDCLNSCNAGDTPRHMLVTVPGDALFCSTHIGFPYGGGSPTDPLYFPPYGYDLIAGDSIVAGKTFCLPQIAHLAINQDTRNTLCRYQILIPGITIRTTTAEYIPDGHGGVVPSPVVTEDHYFAGIEVGLCTRSYRCSVEIFIVSQLVDTIFSGSPSDGFYFGNTPEPCSHPLQPSSEPYCHQAWSAPMRRIGTEMSRCSSQLRHIGSFTEIAVDFCKNTTTTGLVIVTPNGCNS